MKTALLMTLLPVLALAQGGYKPLSLGWRDPQRSNLVTAVASGENYATTPAVTFLSSVVFPAGLRQTAFGFVATGQWSNAVPSSMQNRGPHTFGGWIWRSDNADDQVTVFAMDRSGASAGPILTVQTHSGTKRAIRLQSSGVSSQTLSPTPVVSSNQWHCLTYVATNNVGAGFMYVDGVQVATGVGYNTPASLSSVRFGFSTPTNGVGLCFYYRYAFTPAEVMEHYIQQRRLFP